MNAKQTADQDIRVGEATVVEGPAEQPPFIAVFEDDGETGFFYALDTTRGENPVVDALHIYDVAAVTDKHLPSKVQIVWSEDDRKVGLLINGYPHAVFDFAAKRGYCRSGFPPPSGGEWSAQGHEWDDAALKLFV